MVAVTALEMEVEEKAAMAVEDMEKAAEAVANEQEATVDIQGLDPLRQRRSFRHLLNSLDASRLSGHR